MARTRLMERIYSIPIGNIELAVYGHNKTITLRDVEAMRKAIDVIEETVLINRELETEEYLLRMQRDVETEGMSK